MDCEKEMLSPLTTWDKHIGLSAPWGLMDDESPLPPLAFASFEAIPSGSRK